MVTAFVPTVGPQCKATHKSGTSVKRLGNVPSKYEHDSPTQNTLLHFPLLRLQSKNGFSSCTFSFLLKIFTANSTKGDYQNTTSAGAQHVDSGPSTHLAEEYTIVRTTGNEVRLVPATVSVMKGGVSVVLAASIKIIPPVPSSTCPRPEISEEALRDWRALTLLKCHNLDLTVSLVYNAVPIPGDCTLGRSVCEHITTAPVRIHLTT